MLSNDDMILGIPAMTLGVALLAIFGLALAHAVLRWGVRRKIRRDRAAVVPPHERTARDWIDQWLVEGVPPLALLIWVHGTHLAARMPLAEMDDRGLAQAVAATLEWTARLGTFAALFWLLFRLGRVIEARIGTLGARTEAMWDDVLMPVAGKAVRLLLPLVALILGAPALAIGPEWQELFRNGVSLLVIGTVAYLLFQLVEGAESLVLAQYRLDVRDNLEARKIYTQVTVLKKVALVVIGIFTIASMLMVFESVRQFGTSILASAGIAGIIVGFAAQRSISTLLAGFQIAVTQPIRLDDVVIVENEWGRIEDITLTYVTVRIWDSRRLIVPISYFIEKPFQNWTRRSSDILGSVFLYVDYTVPLQPLREELDRILEASPHWDRRVKVLQVTDAREHTLELRALASAADASLAWDLRCEVREKLVDFLQRNYPDALPRLRAELQPLPVTVNG